jgi:large subunit ribosomal protein L3
MGAHKSRDGSLQFWPRKRIRKLLPSVNWPALQNRIEQSGLLGGIGYKVGMARYLVRDLTADSMTKGKQIIVPVTLIEFPPMRIASIRFYKNSNVAFDIPVSVPEKEAKFLKKVLKLPKEVKTAEKLSDAESKINEFNDIRILVYSIVRATGIKKTPDVAEMGLGGSIADKLKFVKENIDKEIIISDVFKKGNLIDVRGLTKGKGFTGPIKRFGLSLRGHKTEKGRRRPGTLGPWTPSRVTFRAPLAGQMGMFGRIVYNVKIVDVGQASAVNMDFPHYGKIKSTFVAVKGSVQGPPKRQILITTSLRPLKKTDKQNFEVLNLLK